MQNSLLLLKKANSAVSGQWWFPCGRVQKEETLEQTLCGEVKEEIGLEITFSKLINAYSRVFPEGHDITIAYFCKFKDDKIPSNK
jgi:ADP-ribose pyrophosphatase YjhB (NUDIX family)